MTTEEINKLTQVIVINSMKSIRGYSNFVNNYKLCGKSVEDRHQVFLDSLNTQKLLPKDNYILSYLNMLVTTITDTEASDWERNSAIMLLFHIAKKGVSDTTNETTLAN